MTLLIFILILSLLVLVHELGHFFVAKKMGIKVEEFGLGIPPRIFGKQIGETKYSLNLLPFGGFVKLSGEDSEELVEKGKTPVDPRSFAYKTPLQRSLVLVAGVMMNAVLAVGLYYVLLLAHDFKTLSFPMFYDYNFRFGHLTTVDTVISGFSEDSPLKNLDIKPGEAIVKIDNTPVSSVEDVRAQVAQKVGKEVTVTLQDVLKQNIADNAAGDTGTRELVAVPIANEKGVGILGIYMGKSGVLSYETPLEKLTAGFLHSYNMLAYSGTIFSRLVGLSVETKSLAPVSEGVSGPVGIYSVVGGILGYGGNLAILGLIDFTALMSLSLAFLNIMPIPALDGGRLLFVVIEKIRGKKVNPAIEASAHKWGIIVLLALIFLVSIKDYLKFF
ncbi:MAG: hypothetical protein ACD_22C00251G0005 [uncultured bacterium]|nr:MAG: hypothetical protein ACD_22C00251G0005 [uncultured bacterium]